MPSLLEIQITLNLLLKQSGKVIVVLKSPVAGDDFSRKCYAEEVMSLWSFLKYPVITCNLTLINYFPLIPCHKPSNSVNLCSYQLVCLCQ